MLKQMDAIHIFVVCSLAAVVHGNQIQVTLEADRPSVQVQLFQKADLQCCFTTTEGGVAYAWIVSRQDVNGTAPPWRVDLKDNRLTVTEDKKCRFLTLREVQLNDTGLYQCFLHHSALRPSVYTHGTFLQVYKPLEKFLNISESSKNMILTAEGLLLFLCLIIPGYLLLRKSKKLNEQHRRKSRKEEENIYEGLNLDDCCTTYDEIQHSRGNGPYQDVGNRVEEEIQLEKP
ncbi:B-cell antigen receptor complex-associated protein alpha chain [Aplochiton taeniatus]